MSKMRKVLIALACSALLIGATLSTTFAAGPSPKVVKPADSGMYHICIGSTIHVLHTYPSEVTFGGSIWNTCGDTVNVTVTLRPSQVCEGNQTYDSRKTSPLTISTTAVISWSHNVVGDCFSCNTTTHKVTSAPNFDIRELLQISGKTTLGELVKAADQGLTTNVTNAVSVGDPC